MLSLESESRRMPLSACDLKSNGTSCDSTHCPPRGTNRPQHRARTTLTTAHTRTFQHPTCFPVSCVTAAAVPRHATEGGKDDLLWSSESKCYWLDSKSEKGGDTGQFSTELEVCRGAKGGVVQVPPSSAFSFRRSEAANTSLTKSTSMPKIYSGDTRDEQTGPCSHPPTG